MLTSPAASALAVEHSQAETNAPTTTAARALGR
jgi:hypothetical protein